MSTPKTIAVIGGGPVGLAAAAHALERGLTPIVLEAGGEVGHAVRQWGHVPMFSPWEYNIDRAALALLTPTGWNAPSSCEYPTGEEFVERYLAPLAGRTALRNHIRTKAEVVSVARKGFDKAKTRGRGAAPFEVRYRNGAGDRSLIADAIIDASGTWSSPNPAGANGTWAIGEKEVQSHIAYGMPDILKTQYSRYGGKTIAVVGAGHSAVGTLIELTRLKELAPATEIIWVLRGSNVEKSFGGGANDKLSARGALGSALAELVRQNVLRVVISFGIERVVQKDSKLQIANGPCCEGNSLAVDELIVATGFRPEFGFLRELRLNLDPALECSPMLAPLIDPNEHSCGTVRPHGARELSHPEPGFYIAGMKSYGRAPTFLMLTGYEQVRSIVADIAGDKKAAARVELNLPETGVCSGPRVTAKVTECCGGPPATADACCKKDEELKSTGIGGCGSTASKSALAKTTSSASCG